MPRVNRPLTLADIRRWAEYHRANYGRWPRRDDGYLDGAPEVTWNMIDDRLRHGGNGLKGGRTLSQYLRQISGGDLKYGPKKRHLTFKQLLGWIDSHHLRTGTWPHDESGRVADAPDMTWATVHARLKKGDVEGARERSLSRILRDHRGVWDSRGSMRLSPAIVLKLADQHFARTGAWPVTMSGPVSGRKGELWCNIDVAMRNARRGYPRRQSLSQLLQDQRGELYRPSGPQLTESQVMELAAAHERRYGTRPHAKSGDVHRLPGVRWSQINNWLRLGKHGLRGGRTLAEVLAGAAAHA